MEEIWKDVENIENYQISSLGRKHQNKKVHRLVAENFIPKCSRL